MEKVIEVYYGTEARFLYKWPASVQADRPVEARSVILARFLEKYPAKSNFDFQARVREVEVLE